MMTISVDDVARMDFSVAGNSARLTVCLPTRTRSPESTVMDTDEGVVQPSVPDTRRIEMVQRHRSSRFTNVSLRNEFACFVRRLYHTVMIGNRELLIDAGKAGSRLDRFLADAFPASRRSLVVEAISRGDVAVNGRPAAKSARLRAGDRVAVGQLLERVDIAVRPNFNVAVEIVHDDPELLALNKPAGTPVHPLHHAEDDTLANGLIARFPKLRRIGEDPLFPSLLHRLDTDTSGVVLAARTQRAYAALRAQFSAREVTKVYQALVHGRLKEPVTLVNRLIHDPRRRGRMLVVDDRDHVARSETRYAAVTQVAVVSATPTLSLVTATIATGVTHQIRCQLAHAGFPIVGDKVYGRGGDESLLPSRHFLHAHTITFCHPESGGPTTIEAPLPDELDAVLVEGRIGYRRPSV